MKTALQIVLVLLAGLLLLRFLVVLECNSNITDEDKNKLEALTARYPNLHFEFDCDTYLSVQSIDKADFPDDAVFQDIYNFFFLDPSLEHKRDTWFTYLNIYNKDGRFQYQLFRVADKQYVKEHRRSHY